MVQMTPTRAYGADDPLTRAYEINIVLSYCVSFVNNTSFIQHVCVVNAMCAPFTNGRILPKLCSLGNTVNTIRTTHVLIVHQLFIQSFLPPYEVACSISQLSRGLFTILNHRLFQSCRNARTTQKFLIQLLVLFVCSVNVL